MGKSGEVSKSTAGFNFVNPCIRALDNDVIDFLTKVKQKLKSQDYDVFLRCACRTVNSPVFSSYHAVYWLV